MGRHLQYAVGLTILFLIGNMRGLFKRTTPLKKYNQSNEYEEYDDLWFNDEMDHPIPTIQNKKF